MTLSELRILVQEMGQISLKELSLHFGSDESAIEAMMDRWIQKGLVKKVEPTKAQCSGCAFCGDDARFHYEWIGPRVVKFVNK